MATTRSNPLTDPPATARGRLDMTAVVQDRYGPAPEELLRVAQIDRPTITDDDVLVRVHAASVDRGTWHIMAGLPYPIRLAGFGLEDAVSFGSFADPPLIAPAPNARARPGTP